MYTVMPRILCVDDEPNVVDAMARNLRRHFDVTTADGAEGGLDRIEREGPFAVVVSDQRMPGVDGVTFLSRVREAAPDTVRILLTGYADTAAAMGAVNRGAVFRFLSKPIETPELLQTLNLAVEQHRLVTAERVLLERTLHGSIKAIIDVLALVNPQGFGRALRAKETVATLARTQGASDSWQFEVAAMIAQVGAVAVSSGLAQQQSAPGSYAEVESSAVGRLSRITADMVANIPRMEEVHAMLSHQDLRYDGLNGDPRGPRERAIPLGARMLKVAFDLDALESEGLSRTAALERMRSLAGCYDPTLLEGLQPMIVTPPSTITAAPVEAPREVELRMLQPSMVVDEDVRTRAGRLLIARGTPATAENIRQLKSTLDFNELRRKVSVRAAGGAAAAPAAAVPAAAPAPPARATVAAGGMELDLTMRLTV